MNELRVPMNAMQVEALCADGLSFSGRIFVPGFSNRHSGPMRIEEWMNEEAAFFALIPDGAKKAILLNKHEVLVLTFPKEMAEGDDEHGQFDNEHLLRRRVVIECTGKRLTGELVIDMPTSQSRLIDYLNRDERFLTLLDGSSCHLVRKTKINRVIEIDEG